MSINTKKAFCWSDTIERLKTLGVFNFDFSPSTLLLFLAVLGSNAAKVDDAVDSAIFRAFKEANDQSGGQLHDMAVNAHRIDLTGFNPETKRTVATLKMTNGDILHIAKGLLNKILDTSNGGVDSSDVQWRCMECDNRNAKAEIIEYDEFLSKRGYKTLAVAVGIEGPDKTIEWNFAGLLPMLDPPRFDTAITILRLLEAGVEVKMITGDDQKIAKETARLVGLSENIMKGDIIREGTYERDDMVYLFIRRHNTNVFLTMIKLLNQVRHAGGFAQVLPRDKREVCNSRQEQYALNLACVKNKIPIVISRACIFRLHLWSQGCSSSAAFFWLGRRNDWRRRKRRPSALMRTVSID